eukprot:g11233.t1
MGPADGRRIFSGRIRELSGEYQVGVDDSGFVPDSGMPFRVFFPLPARTQGPTTQSLSLRARHIRNACVFLDGQYIVFSRGAGRVPLRAGPSRIPLVVHDVVRWWVFFVGMFANLLTSVLQRERWRLAANKGLRFLLLPVETIFGITAELPAFNLLPAWEVAYDYNTRCSTSTSTSTGRTKDHDDRLRRRRFIVYSHGLTGCTDEHSLLCAEWASLGYTVLAVQHTDGSSCQVQLPSGVRRNFEFTPFVAEDAAIDAAVDARVGERVKPILAGFSYGAATTQLATQLHYEEVRAALSIDGWYLLPFGVDTSVTFPRQWWCISEDFARMRAVREIQTALVEKFQVKSLVLYRGVIHMELCDFPNFMFTGHFAAFQSGVRRLIHYLFPLNSATGLRSRRPVLQVLRDVYMSDAEIAKEKRERDTGEGTLEQQAALANRGVDEIETEIGAVPFSEEWNQPYHWWIESKVDRVDSYYTLIASTVDFLNELEMKTKDECS